MRALSSGASELRGTLQPHQLSLNPKLFIQKRFSI